MLTTGKFVLDKNGEPVEENDLFKWAEWIEVAGEKRRVALDENGRGVTVSTVFLGLDFNFSDGGCPHLFETMVFTKGGKDAYTERTATRKDAIEVHKSACKRFRVPCRSID